MSLAIDIKYTARLLLKKPIFTLLTVLIVAIGLGLTLYTYSLLNNLVFKPLLLNGDTEILAIEGQFDHNHMSRTSVDPFHLNRVRNEIALVDQLGLYTEGTALITKPNNGTKKFNSTFTEWNLFEFAGVPPILGRGLQVEDQFEGAEPVIVIGYSVWRDYFNEDPAIVGTTVQVEGTTTRIVGVMPNGFAFPATAETWQPLAQANLYPTSATHNRGFAYARLKPDVTREQFYLALADLNKEIVETMPEAYIYRIEVDGLYLRAIPMKIANITQFYSIFIALFFVVLLILALACINVSNLLLVRVNERYKEIAIRIALGIPKRRLILQMLWESIFICSAGGILALLFAGYGMELSNAVLERTFAVNQLKPFWWQISIDHDGLFVLLFAVIAMIIVTGCIPAWRALSGDFNAVLKDGTRGSLSKKAAQASKILVISEILLSCVVLVIATIILTTSYSAGNADYGVKTNQRLTARIELPLANYPVRRDTEFAAQDRQQRTAFFYKLKDELEAQANIEAVAYMSSFPGTGEGTSFFEIEGRAAAVFNENPYSNNEIVSRDAWRAIDMRIIAGRDFDQRDIGPDVRPVVINASIARDFFPDGDAVGKRVRRAGRLEHGEWNTIIGVVSDTFHGSTMFSSSASYNSYHVMDSFGITRINMVIHYLGTEAMARTALVAAVNAIDSEVAAYHIQSYDKMIEQPMMLIAAISKIFLLCGIIALFLAASGIYAVAANSVTQRTQEIGVRRALGANDKNIMRLFMGQAVSQLITGLVLGVLLSIWLVHSMTDIMVINQLSYLIGLIAMPMLISMLVLFATYIPSKKIVTMEPSDALHHD
jgi:putative ABC transport system permease protein